MSCVMEAGQFYHSKTNRIYLDHNATTPLAQCITEVLPQWLPLWGNPSSVHQDARGPKTLIRQAREDISKMVDCHPLEIIFTSGGSEANNLVIKGYFDYLEGDQVLAPPQKGRKKYLVSGVEHPSVIKSFEYLSSRGAEIETIAVSLDGEVDLDKFEKQMSEDVALVSVMFANNETGNIFPIKKMVKIAHKYGALFHMDGVQALGKVPISLKHLDVDFATFSGHKFYALKGCGFAFVRSGLNLKPLVSGGGQERGRRAGTENILAIGSLGVMAKMQDQVLAHGERIGLLRDHLENQILSQIQGVKVTGQKTKRLPNTSSIIISGVDGETLLMNLDMKGFSVSTGAACSSGNTEPSPVLLAMGLSVEEAQSSLRLGLGWGTTEEDINEFLKVLIPMVDRLRKLKENEGSYE